MLTAPTDLTAFAARLQAAYEAKRREWRERHPHLTKRQIADADLVVLQARADRNT